MFPSFPKDFPYVPLTFVPCPIAGEYVPDVSSLVLSGPRVLSLQWTLGTCNSPCACWAFWVPCAACAACAHGTNGCPRRRSGTPCSSRRPWCPWCPWGWQRRARGPLGAECCWGQCRPWLKSRVARRKIRGNVGNTGNTDFDGIGDAKDRSKPSEMAVS